MDVKKSWDAIASDSPTATPLPPMTPSPTPTLFLYPSPTLANSIQPSVVYEMGLNTLSENGWSEIPGGFNTAMAGITTIGLLPQNAISSSRDNRGIQIQVQESQVVFLYAQTSLQTGGSPVLVRALVRADAPMCSITLAALKGDLQSMQGVDGSIATYMPMTASGYMEKERFISLLYKPDSGEIFTPVIQVASTGTAPARVWIDRIEVYRLPAGNESPGYLFYSNWLGDDQPVATSTPLPPTAIPTPTPFSIPTYTPTFTPTWTPTPGVVPTPTATFTPPSSEGWILLAEDPQGDMDDTLFDIKQLWIRLSGAELSFRFVTYSAWPSESIRKNQGMFEIYLNTDNNLNTGYMIAGADYLLSVGTDFFTDGYVEVVSQWSDPDGFGDDFYAIMNIRRVESSNSNTLDITVNRVDIGNPTSIQIYSSIFNVDTFGLDECPDEGYAQYP